MTNASLYDAPWDFTQSRETHRFPPAVQLRRDLADEERIRARETLHAVNDAASVRIGLAGGLVIGLVVGVALLVVGIEDFDRLVVVKLAAGGALLCLGLVVLVGLIRRHTAAAGDLASRVWTYERRLAELDDLV